MNNERIIHLLKAYQEQTLTPEERSDFASLLHDKRYENLFNQVLDKQWNELEYVEIDELTISGYDRILKETKLQSQDNKRNINWWPRIAVAAAIILVAFGTSFYFYKSNLTTHNSQLTTHNDVAPGKNGAILTLANGQKILIKDALAGNIANESGVKITKAKDGMIIYEIAANDNGPLGYNTLSTTRGEQTQVRLQDGTVVFLNAESSLKYPTSFAKTQKRQVSLTGEGYFEVAKDKQHPFVVEAGHQTVEVLGTTFNISSYTDEATIKTTLLEGSVNVKLLPSPSGEGLGGRLKPGEQATVNGETLNIKPVEVSDVVAWKNGYFMFNNETLADIMKKVSRWYNVEVLYTDDAMKRKTFFGSVSRFDNVSELLKLLQKTEGATFEIKGRQIIVGQK